ncbi:ATP phosphoribosyltransferase regulatory subunit [candidate division KSB1 bacterium]|nr:ATP phosphoribosyltransferase regulatory subunit [candidate division KSB1 bacterium]
MEVLNDKENQALRLPPGVKDFLFDEAAQHRTVERRLTDLLAGSGYREIITPTVEYGEVFLLAGKTRHGRNTLDEKVHRFLDRDGNLLALRADFTAQIARIAASRFVGMIAPIRLYYSGKVFRAEPQHAGRSREKWQVGFEILGANDIETDAEAVTNILDTLAALKIDDARVFIGNVDYFNGIMAHAGIEGERLQTLKYLVERKDAGGLAQTMEDFSLPSPVREVLTQIQNLHGGREILPEVRQLAQTEISRQAVDRLEALLAMIQKHAQADNVFLNLGEAEGMGYYTGLTLRVLVAGVDEVVGSGGRYDELISRFGVDVPAVGFAFDLDLLVNAISNGA